MLLNGCPTCLRKNISTKGKLISTKIAAFKNAKVLNDSREAVIADRITESISRVISAKPVSEAAPRSGKICFRTSSKAVS